VDPRQQRLAPPARRGDHARPRRTGPTVSLSAIRAVGTLLLRRHGRPRLGQVAVHGGDVVEVVGEPRGEPSAIATERCCPPVQPIADREARLARWRRAGSSASAG
jgi:hypothetical protein